MLWNEEGDEDVDIEETDHACREPLTFGETVDVLDRENGGPWSRREYGYATLEADVSVRETSQQSLDELIDFLPRLTRKITDPCLQN
jgi:hypothetical protein